MESSEDRIRDLENEIASLPSGYISNKTINGVNRKYYQWTENGKKKSKYLDPDSAGKLAPLIERRRQLQSEIKSLKKSNSDKDFHSSRYDDYSIKNILLTEDLVEFVKPIKELKKRSCISKLQDFLDHEPSGKVFILYGLRRTGKTTLMKQAILSLSEHALDKTAFIQLETGDTLAEVNSTLRALLKKNYKYVFIDEVTLAEDYIEGAALLSDIYAASGMKIVLSGTDSLGFVFSESEELYDRCIMLHTTYIPYGEFERVLGITGIDEYIRYGGTMSLGGTHYNAESTFKTKKSTDEYIDSAIARNIQHSLKYYQYGSHFRALAELYDKNELTSVINRVVEDINHRFTIDVLTADFKSHDLGISRKNLRKDRDNPTDVLDNIDIDTFTTGLKIALDILNKDEQTVVIDDAHRTEIKEYLDLLDLTVDILIETIPISNEKSYRTVIAQPGLRYAQAAALVNQLLRDKSFQDISAEDRKRILERILNEIRGRMMEDIVVMETMRANPDKEVFRLQFAVGEFDMVVVDPESVSCEIYEIKHSSKVASEQSKNLVDMTKVKATEFRFGKITKKAVIYKGPDTMDGDVYYLNVEEYLRTLNAIN